MLCSLLNPYCCLGSILFESINIDNFSLMTFSKILLTEESKLIGLYESGEFGGLFGFGIAIVLDIFQEFGK